MIVRTTFFEKLKKAGMFMEAEASNIRIHCSGEKWLTDLEIANHRQCISWRAASSFNPFLQPSKSDLVWFRFFWGRKRYRALWLKIKFNILPSCLVNASCSLRWSPEVHVNDSYVKAPKISLSSLLPSSLTQCEITKSQSPWMWRKQDFPVELDWRILKPANSRIT